MNRTRTDGAARAFLTAEWRYVAMLSFDIDPRVLAPLVPAGTELDTRYGHTFISLVGFRFVNTRVLGMPIPFHRNFDEVNLRFYVRREAAGELRRGVVFIREVVPRRAIAWLARLAYNEPYVAATMRSVVPPGIVANPGRVSYEWRVRDQTYEIAVVARGSATVPTPESEPAFIAEHYWGYTKQRDGGVIEYRVTHPAWRVWGGAEPAVSGDVSGFCGGAIGDALSQAPASAFVAEGSPVTVHYPTRIR